MAKGQKGNIMNTRLNQKDLTLGNVFAKSSHTGLWTKIEGLKIHEDEESKIIITLDKDGEFITFSDIDWIDAFRFDNLDSFADDYEAILKREYDSHEAEYHKSHGHYGGERGC